MNQLDQSKLNPCPFCGGVAEMSQSGRNSLTVKCKDCKVTRKQSFLHKDWEWLENIQVEWWNKRVMKAREVEK